MTSENGLSNTPLWEKLVGLFGLVLVLGTIVFLVWSATTQQDEAPDINFTVHETSALGSRFLVLFDVQNRGELTAADLGVEAKLLTADGNSSSTEIRIDYLAAGSSRRLGVYFDANPEDGNLEFRALGYQNP